MFEEKRQQLAALSVEKRALLEARLLKAIANPQIILSPTTNTATPELSFAQQSLWFLANLEPNNPFYNIPQAFRIRGALNFQALQKSLQAIIQRHEVLRTQFFSEDGRPKPRIVHDAHFNLPILDLSHLSEGDQHEQVARLVAEEGECVFNLERDLMLRAGILHLAPEENILLLTAHHIASDHWSFAVLYRELLDLYEKFCTHASATLPPLKNQYSDFARKEKAFLKSETFHKQLAYWTKQLSGELPQLDLPTDHARPKKQSFRGARKFLFIPSELSKRLKNLSQHEGSTLFVTLLSAFQTMLHRYSDQSDMIIGTPFGARQEIENEPLIGYFLNTLVLRTDLSGDPTFCELMQRTRRISLDAFTNGNIPFEKLVDELRVPHRTDRNPLFQVIFQYQPTMLPVLTLAGTKAEPIEIETGTSKMDLVFTIAESENGLTGDLEYNTDLFDGETIEHLLQQYRILLESIATDPLQKISRLALMSERERQKLLVDWTDTRTDYPRERTISQLFEEQSARTPDAVALAFDKEELTYRELNERANELAHHLRECDVGPNVLVGIALDRSPELFISLIAILKAGGAYVPLESTYPEERLKFILDDTAIAHLITDKPFSFFKARKTNPKEFLNLAPQRSMPDVPRLSTPEDLAYVMYTSGSTGKPKGVAVPHRAVVRLVKNTNYMTFGPDQVFLQFAPVSFDASTLEIWGSLLNGAKLVIHPPHLPSLEELGATLQRHSVTTLWLTAGLFHQMVEHQIESLRGVKQLLAGGDILSVSHVRKVLEQLPDCQLINGYGPTENTTFTCCYPIPKTWSGRSVPIGKPISNTQVYILDKNLEPTPIGVPGELLIGGDGLAREYLNRPELNEEKFIPNPFQAGKRLYRTGDRVRYRSDGTIEFFGRIDNQVKIRGFRIELEEIEAALAEYPFVQQSAVTTKPTSTNEKIIIAYVVLGGTSAQSAAATEQLKSFLKTKLPGYMIPSAIIALDQLPLTNNGKIDRRQLPDPESYSGTAKTDIIAPRNETETRLIEIWREVLGRNHFGIQENFFELGGHSLLATQVISRIAQKFQITFPLQKIFEFPTIESLAVAVNQTPREASRPQLVRRSRPGSMPVTNPNPNKDLIDTRG